MRLPNIVVDNDKMQISVDCQDKADNNFTVYLENYLHKISEKYLGLSICAAVTYNLKTEIMTELSRLVNIGQLKYYDNMWCMTHVDNIDEPMIVELYKRQLNGKH